MSYIFLAFIFVCSAQASLQKIQIKEMNLNYAAPYGSGDLHKLSIGISTNKSMSYPVEVFRQDKTFLLTSPFVDFEWLDPLSFVFNLKTVNVQKFHMGLDYKEHTVSAESLKFSTKPEQVYSFKDFNLSCFGDSTAEDPLERLRHDCLLKLSVKASRLDFPFEIQRSHTEELPPFEAEAGLDLPADDFSLSVDAGKFHSYVRIKYLVRSYFRIWGHAQIENEGKVLAIRIDSIKYGILPVTTLVMNQLRRQIQNPDIKIDPPWIRVTLGSK